MFIIRIFIFFKGLISSIIFDLTRVKLIDERQKYDFLIEKFQHLSEKTTGSHFYKSISVRMPKTPKEDWKVVKTLGPEDDYKQTEIMSFTDNNLELSLFKNEINNLSKNKV